MSNERLPEPNQIQDQITKDYLNQLIRLLRNSFNTVQDTLVQTVADVLAYKTIVVSGQDDVAAEVTDDTLTLASGVGIAITTNATTDTITITATPNAIISAVGITIDGSSLEPSLGSKGLLPVPYSGTIQHWYLTSDVTGDCVIDVKRSGVSIIGGGGNKPTLATQQFNDDPVSGWTSTVITAEDVIEFNLDSVTDCTRITLVLKVSRT